MGVRVDAQVKKSNKQRHKSRNVRNVTWLDGMTALQDAFEYGRQQLLFLRNALFCLRAHVGCAAAIMHRRFTHVIQVRCKHKKAVVVVHERTQHDDQLPAHERTAVAARRQDRDGDTHLQVALPYRCEPRQRAGTHTRWPSRAVRPLPAPMLLSCCWMGHVDGHAAARAEEHAQRIQDRCTHFRRCVA